MPSRPFIPAPNCASVELIYSHATEISENVFHVQKGSPYSLSDLQALRATVDAWDNATGKQGRVGAATLNRIRTKALDTNSSPMEDYSLPTPRAGSIGSGVALPLNVAFCCKLATGLAGRSYRGRWYWGHLSSASMDDVGFMSAASVSAYVGFLTTLISDLADDGHTMVVVSYFNNGSWRTTAAATEILSVVAVDRALDSQRRRLPGRGHAV